MVYNSDLMGGTVFLGTQGRSREGKESSRGYQNQMSEKKVFGCARDVTLDGMRMVTQISFGTTDVQRWI